MKKKAVVSVMLYLVLAVVLTVATCFAAEIETTGVLGSPGATTTIGGKQLPAPDPKFGGVIKDDALQSKEQHGRESDDAACDAARSNAFGPTHHRRHRKARYERHEQEHPRAKLRPRTADEQRAA